MSPGSTMMRVYAAIKARIMAGEFAPGERIDPNRVAFDLGSSPTPVREALLRLLGERLIEAGHQDGFRQPHIVEPGLRDLYRWSGEVMGIVVHAASWTGVPSAVDRAAAARPYGARVSDVFMALATMSANHEHRFVVANLNDRMALFRGAEARCIAGASDEVDVLATSVQHRDIDVVLHLLEKFHERRLDHVEQISGLLRRE